MPVGGPGDADGVGGLGDVVEELGSVVVFAVVCYAGGVVNGGEVGAVEVADEVLSYAAADGGAWLDGEVEEPHGGVGALDSHLQ